MTAPDGHLPLLVDEIIIPDGRRQAKPADVKKLAESIAKIGLRHPITVRRKGDDYVLIAGLHRLEAFRRLGEEHIPCLITSMSKAEARMWEIAENLHRAELTVQERADQLGEWVQLCNGQVDHSRGGKPNKGISEASRQLGVGRKDVERAVKIASISPEAKEVAREAGINDNQSKLLRVAAEPAARQVAAVHHLAPTERNARSWKFAKQQRKERAKADAQIILQQFGSECAAFLVEINEIERVQACLRFELDQAGDLHVGGAK
jgi:ParB/RepB/Spo0J family partition protein